MNVPLFYKDKPIFGLDIGQSSIKILELKKAGSRAVVAGYAYGTFDRSARSGGVITKPELLTSAIKKILNESVVGQISSQRVMLSVPISQTYTRIMNPPTMDVKDLAEAVRLEADQYIPVPSDQLYIEHHQLPSTGKTLSVLVVAVQRKIIDGLMQLCEQLHLEVAGIEPTMLANLRSVHLNCPKHVPKIIIDFGAHSSDLAIFDNELRLTSTVATGGDNVTAAIARGLNLPSQQAHDVKIYYGIAKSKYQAQLASILQPILSDFANEVQKTMRYYHEHSGGQSISDIFLVGGGASLPGLSDFLSHLTGVRVQICNPWSQLQTTPLQPPHPAESTVYATAIGLALREMEKP